MSNTIKFIFLSTFFMSLTAFAEDCDEFKSGTYGVNGSFQRTNCKTIRINAESEDKKSRKIIFGHTGMLQVFSDVGGRSSSSTGFRVYYLFPKQTTQKIVDFDNDHLTAEHSSGARFNFDKNGKISSPDVELRVSPNINIENKGGIEIERFSKGIVIDVGYRIGVSPNDKPESMVTVTDKNKKKCTFPNSSWQKRVDKYELTLKYTTNESLHGFLKETCPGLDISDLLRPMKQNLEDLTKVKNTGGAPKVEASVSVNDNKRDAASRPNNSSGDALGDLINNIESKNAQK